MSEAIARVVNRISYSWPDGIYWTWSIHCSRIHVYVCQQWSTSIVWRPGISLSACSIKLSFIVRRRTGTNPERYESIFRSERTWWRDHLYPKSISPVSL